MRKLLFMFLLLFTGLQVTAQERNVVEEASHKVIFQMTSSDPAEQKALLNNLNNLKNLWGTDVQIHVVIHGPGIEMVLREKTALKEGIYKVLDRGVVFQACENTLKQKNIEKSELLERVEFVSSGLAEIITKQEQGWTYIKSNF